MALSQNELNNLLSANKKSERESILQNSLSIGDDWFYNPEYDVFARLGTRGADYWATADEMLSGKGRFGETWDPTHFATARKEAMENVEGLLNKKFQGIYDLSTQLLQPKFMEQRGALSEALQTTGQRRSSTFANTFEKQLSDENLAFAGVLNEVLNKQIDIEEAEKDRTLRNLLSKRETDAAKYGADISKYGYDQARAGEEAKGYGNIVGSLFNLLSKL